MDKRLYLISVVTSVTLFATAAVAEECEIDGEKYPEGTTYHGYVCQDGEWVEQDS